MGKYPREVTGVILCLFLVGCGGSSSASAPSKISWNAPATPPVQEKSKSWLPSAPLDVLAIETKSASASVTVSWQSPLYGGWGMPTGYLVRTIPTGESVTVNGQARTAQISKLKYGFHYQFTVTALSLSGPGPSSSPTPSLTLAVTTIAGFENVTWTFDDCEYSAVGNVNHILAVLQKHRVKNAIFFYIGTCAANHPDQISKIKAMGYLIGNHTLDHADLALLPLNNGSGVVCGIRCEISGGPKHTYWFRPPYGAYNNLVVQAVREAGLHMMLWTATAGDTSSDPASRTCQSVLNLFWATIKPDSIVLQHMFRPDSTRALDAFLSNSHSCIGF